MDHVANKQNTPWGLLLATGAALGAGVPTGKLAVAAGVSPLEFVLLPALPIGVCLAVLAWARHGWPARPLRLALFGLASGLLGSALPNGLAAWVSTHVGAGFAGMAYTLPPLLTLALSVALGLEPARWQRALAVLLGLAGAVWLAAAKAGSGGLETVHALALLLISASIAVGNIVRPRLLPKGAPAEWLGAAMWAGVFALLLPIWLGQESGPTGLANAAGAGWLLLQVGLGATGAILYFRLQLRAEPVTMSFVGYALAATAMLFGTVLLGEQLPWQIVPAAALIAAGFWLIQNHPPMREAQ